MKTFISTVFAMLCLLLGIICVFIIVGISTFGMALNMPLYIPFSGMILLLLIVLIYRGIVLKAEAKRRREASVRKQNPSMRGLSRSGKR